MMNQKFNSTIDIWILELDKLNYSQLLKKPGPDSWSLGQVYQHIIAESNWYNSQIEASLPDLVHANVETTKEAKMLFEIGSFPDQIIKGEPSISENVKQPNSINELKEGLEKLQSDTNLIWNKIQNFKNYGKSEHPGIGFLNCYEWIQYSEMHMRHHLKQKRRIEDSLRQMTS